MLRLIKDGMLLVPRSRPPTTSFSLYYNVRLVIACSVTALHLVCVNQSYYG